MHEPSAFASHEDKQSEASTATVGDAGGIADEPPRPPLPHELTAEWTVRAQLTFARAGERVRREFSSHDPLNPVRVVYKWTNLDGTLDDEQQEQVSREKQTATTGNRWSRQSTPLKPTSFSQRSHSFRSTTSSTGNVTAGGSCGGGAGADNGGADSAFSGSNISRQPRHTACKSQSSKSNGGAETTPNTFYGTRCRSTCNIVVSAVADFLPPEAYGTNIQHTTSNTSTATDCFIPEEEPDPFVFNTTASYTVLPQKVIKCGLQMLSSAKHKVESRGVHLKGL